MRWQQQSFLLPPFQIISTRLHRTSRGSPRGSPTGRPFAQTIASTAAERLPFPSRGEQASWTGQTKSQTSDNFTVSSLTRAPGVPGYIACRPRQHAKSKLRNLQLELAVQSFLTFTLPQLERRPVLCSKLVAIDSIKKDQDLRLSSMSSLMWFRKGLRLHDNPALLAAIEGAKHVYPVFILDPYFLRPDPSAPSPGSTRVGINRIQFLLQSLQVRPQRMPNTLLQALACWQTAI